MMEVLSCKPQCRTSPIDHVCEFSIPFSYDTPEFRKIYLRKKLDIMGTKIMSEIAWDDDKNLYHFDMENPS